MSRRTTGRIEAFLSIAIGAGSDQRGDGLAELPDELPGGIGLALVKLCALRMEIEDPVVLDVDSQPGRPVAGGDRPVGQNAIGLAVDGDDFILVF